ncbi:hypothetical protein BYT27DRAFT_6610011 [Phlegmacium glaucopus]|nr:hypothetical protein BYT27DRAFT_6610011 [Phlegmacium glaucopus]
MATNSLCYINVIFVHHPSLPHLCTSPFLYTSSPHLYFTLSFIHHPPLANLYFTLFLYMIHHPSLP